MRPSSTLLLFSILLCGPCIAQIDVNTLGELPSIIRESSGLARDASGIYWTINDDDEGRVYAVQENGVFAGQILLDGVDQVDFEDLALDGAGRLYIGDFGNNDNDRTDLVIYRVDDPLSVLSSSVQPEAITFSLSDQVDFSPADDDLNYDIEAMVVRDNIIHLFSRNRTTPFDGELKEYRLPAEPGDHIAMLSDTFINVLSPAFGSITAADLSADGHRLALLSRGAIRLFFGSTEEAFFERDTQINFFSSTSAYEGLAFADGCRLIISEEGDSDTNGRMLDFDSCALINDLHEERNKRLQVTVTDDRLLVDSAIDSQSTIIIYDMAGRKVSTSMGQHIIDISHLSDGIYVVTLLLDKEWVSQRIYK